MSDCGESEDLLAEWSGLIAQCKAKGGKPSEERWWE
jgi:hypothetical protein